MGKGKKNKVKHVARKAVEKTKYITVEDVYEPRHSVEAADALTKTEEFVKPMGEPEVNNEPADEAKTSSEPASGESEPAALAGGAESYNEPVGAVEELAKPEDSLAELNKPSSEPDSLVEFEDAFYGVSKLVVDDVEESNEPVGKADQAAEVLDEADEAIESVGMADEAIESVGVADEIVESLDKADNVVEPADEAKELAGAVEEFADSEGAIEELADKVEEPTGDAEELASTVEEPADITEEPEESVGAAEESAEPASEAEQPVEPADAGGQADDRAAEVRHGAHAALKKQEDVVCGANSETVETAPQETPKDEPAKKFSLPIMVGIAVAALVVGLLVGMFLLGGAGSSAVTGKSVVSEGELDSPIASYSYQGKSGSITVREVIEQSTSLEAAKDADGNYQVPTADTALGVVRNKLLVAEAERQGISVADEDIAEYAITNLGTDDFETIAASYQMDVDAVKALLREACLLGKLRDAVAPAQDIAMPDPPAQPGSDDEDALTAPTKEYADYIIALVGDEWDAKKGAWAAKDGPYASGLADVYEITAKGATYEAAMAAYYIAYQLYAQESAETSTQWADYVNSILSNATIEVYTLVA